MLVPLSACVLLSMDPDLLKMIAIGIFFLGMVTLIFWSNWHHYTPRGFLFFCGALLCIAPGVMFALHSTLPSSAPRKEVQGRLSWVVEHRHGKSTDYTFAIQLDSDASLPFRAAAVVPRFAQGEMLAVTYLDEHLPNEYSRAISIQVLSGQRAGWSNSVSADWFGPWLGVPLSIAAMAWFFVLAKRNVRTKGKTHLRHT